MEATVNPSPPYITFWTGFAAQQKYLVIPVIPVIVGRFHANLRQKGMTNEMTGMTLLPVVISPKKL